MINKKQESNLNNFEFAMELQRRYGNNVKIPTYNKNKIVNCGRRFGKPGLFIPSLAKEILSPEDYERLMQEYKKVVEHTEREYKEMREIMQHREGYSFVAIDEMEEQMKFNIGDMVIVKQEPFSCLPDNVKGKKAIVIKSNYNSRGEYYTLHFQDGNDLIDFLDKDLDLYKPVDWEA